ncbi:MAG TPA: NAD(P)-dependent oxidoreductase [Polyangia bacterium]|nr:NAD(P)-dependent oxidoreductase [Polyangia bacterium]
MRVLVTGSSGFIGSAVVEDLGRAGHDVLAVDRVPASGARRKRWPALAGEAAIDLEDPAAVGRCLRDLRPEALVHLAWYADPADYLTSPANLSSLSVTLRLLDSALEMGCRKLVVSGSCVEYAASTRPLDERDATAPTTLYGACKQAAGTVARVLCGSAGAELSWARIFHLHGPGEDRRRLIPWVAGELRAGRPVELTDGTQVRDHLHVADVAAGLRALLAPGAAGIFNVCSGEPVTLRQVLETVGDLVGRPELLRFGARPHRLGETMFLAGTSARLRALGWAPRFDLRGGLADALGGAA